MGHSHYIYDADTHFIINPLTRKIINSVSSKSLMQYDHNCERFTFELPRYIEGHDMSLCNRIEVHFLNIGTGGQRNEGVYEVDDWQISPDDDSVVICSWLISANATQLAGSLNVLLRFACVADDGTIEYAWHTEIFSGITVSNGMNNGEAVSVQYPDVLEQWKAELLSGMTGILGEARNAAQRAEEAAQRAEDAEPSVTDEHINELIDAYIGGALGGEF